MSHVEKSALHTKRIRGIDEPKESEPIRIIAGAVERVSFQGPERHQGNEQLFAMLDRARELTKLGDPLTSQDGEEMPTQVLIVPVETLDPLATKRQKGAIRSLISRILSPKTATPVSHKWHARDAAMCFATRARHPSAAWEGSISGIVVMSQESINIFYRELNGNPVRLFDLIQEVNRGPINCTDGTRAEVTPGKCIAILPNKAYGGGLDHVAKTKPFTQ